MTEHSLDALYIMTEQEKDLFQRALQTLVTSTFIIKQLDKDREIYRFVLSNYGLCESYLACIGWNLRKDEHLGIIACEGSPSRAVSLNLEETLSLLVFRLLYENKRLEVSLAQEHAVHQYEFHEKYTILTKRVLNKTRMREILHRFKMLKLIQVIGDEVDPDTLILLYPSIAFIVDSETINDVHARIEELTGNKTNEEDTEDSSC